MQPLGHILFIIYCTISPFLTESFFKNERVFMLYEMFQWNASKIVILLLEYKKSEVGTYLINGYVDKNNNYTWNIKW